MNIYQPTPASSPSDDEATLTYAPLRGARHGRNGNSPRPSYAPPRPTPGYVRPAHPVGGPPWAPAPPAPYGLTPTWPAPPYGVAPQPPSPPTAEAPRKRRGKWLAAAAAVTVSGAAVLGVVVTGNQADAPRDVAGPAVSTTQSTAPSTPATPPITSAQLSDILLTPVAAADIIDSGTLIGHEVDGMRIFEAMADDEIVDQDCISMLPVMETAYQGSGYVAVRVQSLRDPVGNKRFTQGAVTFGNAAAASRYVASAKKSWEACANRSVDFGFTSKSDHDFWSVGDVNEADGVLTFTETQEGGGGWSCQGALAARNNVVVDLFTCGEHVSGLTAVRLANAMTNKVDDQE